MALPFLFSFKKTREDRGDDGTKVYVSLALAVGVLMIESILMQFV